MSDLIMCGSKACPVRHDCTRSPASGTVPNRFRQQWFDALPVEGHDCGFFLARPRVVLQFHVTPRAAEEEQK